MIYLVIFILFSYISFIIIIFFCLLKYLSDNLNYFIGNAKLARNFDTGYTADTSTFDIQCFVLCCCTLKLQASFNINRKMFPIYKISRLMFSDFKCLCCVCFYFKQYL